VSTIGIFWFAKLFSVVVLVYRLWLGRVSDAFSSEEDDVGEKPMVCVQLPLFNELGQVAGLLGAVGGLEWPSEKLVIQILDDSNDTACRSEVDAAFRALQARHPEWTVQVLRRPSREGYKAGALNAGVQACPEASLFALFDCDFRPARDFLEKMVREFHREPRVAAVQAPWSFRNPKENLLTRLQTVLLGVHFHAEHHGRQARRWVLNFNGTAGLWRREALEALGGWSAETVTEDLLLSYRAELAGWRIRYTEVVLCSSELPSTLASYLVQQRRWAKGHGQVLRLLGSSVLRKTGWGVAKKFDALFHLHSYGVSVLLAGLLLVLPFWVAERSTWAAQLAASSPERLADAGLWLMSATFFLVFFSRRRLSEMSLQATLKERVASAGILLLFLPYLSVLILPRFLVGLFTRKKGSCSAVFERTPKAFSAGKERCEVGRGDRVCVWALSAYFLVVSGLCIVGELWFLAATFAVQAFAGPRLLAEGARSEPLPAFRTALDTRRVVIDGEGT
jgi:cellulose synthase/poly-beta-1,6-N-acetylglucosamine synthase-like glycosyltransferase